jgi:hypothetical protein
VSARSAALAEDSAHVWRVEAFQQQVAVIEVLRCVMVPSTGPLLYICHLGHCCTTDFEDACRKHQGEHDVCTTMARQIAAFLAVQDSNSKHLKGLTAQNPKILLPTDGTASWWMHQKCAPDV